MSIATEAYSDLFPGKEPTHGFKLKYSARFNSYNANVYYNRNAMEFRLSKQWKSVSREIRIGLIQTLMLKVFGGKKETMHMDLYNIFLKKIHVTAPKTRSDPMLEASFNYLNQRYFDSMMEMPNLAFGQYSKRKLGSYEYGSDTITISRILSGQPELLDYVMYHEMLHKKLKFYTRNSRSYHHTREFKNAEKMFENHDLMEKQLNRFLRSKQSIWKLF